MERGANIITIAVVCVVFFFRAMVFLYPPYGLNRLRIVLAISDLIWAIVYLMTFCSVIGLIPLPLPSWYLWTIRFSLIIFGIGSISELTRAGAFRLYKTDRENDE